MLIILFLLALSSAQVCPYCQYNACQTTYAGLGNCSACNMGALVQVQTLSSYGTYQQETIGVCQQCPAGCSTCSYAMISPAMSPGQLVINCTQCNPYYAYNYSIGTCAPCAANCLSCQCEGDTCWATSCSTCAPGYTLGANYLCATSAALEDQTSTDANNDNSNNNNNVIYIVSSVAGVVVPFVIYLIWWWCFKREAKPQAALLNSEIEVSKTSA